MSGRTNASVASILVDPAAFRESQPWANFVCSAHTNTCLMERSFTVEKYTTANPIAPRGNIITSAGDPSSISQDLLPSIPMDTIPRLDEVDVAPKGILFIASGI